MLRFLIEQYRTKFVDDGQDPEAQETKVQLLGMERQIRKLEEQLMPLKQRPHPEMQVFVDRYFAGVGLETPPVFSA